jgi:uncharacterized protein (DUF2252 family)
VGGADVKLGDGVAETRDDRLDRGRALRERVPRSSHGEWTPRRDRRDPIAVLERQGASRVPELLPVRYARMAESPFAFYRGAAAVMAMDLARTPATGIRVQACGDAHVNNFGKFATPERNVVFDINDFDETLPGPWEWDVKRLCASLAVVAEQRGFRSADRDAVVMVASHTYRERMARFARRRTLDVWYEKLAITDVIQHFPPKYQAVVRRDLERAERRDHRSAAAKLTRDVGGEVRFVEDPPLVVHLTNTEHDMDDVLSTFDDYRRSLSEERRALIDRFHIVDVARRVVGVGSVGTRCWLVLFEGPHHPKGDPLMLQVKEAQASVLEEHVGASEFSHHGQRVVAGQRMTQASSDMFLGWCSGRKSGRNFYVRQMWDVKGQSDPLSMSPDGLGHYGAVCAWALARAHARTGDAVAITGYLGQSGRFDGAMVEFAKRYAKVNAQDHARLLEAIHDRRIRAT